MLRLFRLKMISVVKYFRIWLARNVKIRVWQMPQESGNVRSPLPDFSLQVWSDSNRTLPNPAKSRSFWPHLARSVVGSCKILTILPRSGRLLTMVEIRQYSGQFLPEFGLPISGDSGWISPDSGTDRFTAIGCCRTLPPPEFRRPTIVEF
jgi:hypothetical protein